MMYQEYPAALLAMSIVYLAGCSYLCICSMQLGANLHIREQGRQSNTSWGCLHWQGLGRLGRSDGGRGHRQSGSAWRRPPSWRTRGVGCARRMSSSMHDCMRVLCHLSASVS